MEGLAHNTRVLAENYDLMGARGPILRLLRSVERKESPMTTGQLVWVWIVIILNVFLVAYGIIQLILTGHWPEALKD